MKKTRDTDEQIAFALKQAETGTPVAEVIRRMGISEQTFYRWKKVYGGVKKNTCGIHAGLLCPAQSLNEKIAAVGILNDFKRRGNRSKRGPTTASSLHSYAGAGAVHAITSIPPMAPKVNTEAVAL